MSIEIINGIFAITGAVIGAVIAGLFAWVLQIKYRSKKELKILLSKPKRLVDIHDTLKGLISINIAGEEVETVANIDYFVMNTGNEVLSNILIKFEFNSDLRILGGNCPSANFSVMESEDFTLHLNTGNTCEIKAHFLNPGEEIRGHLLLNKIPKKTKVTFRQPNVSLKLEKEYDSARTTMITDVLYEAAKSNFILDAYLKLALPAYRKHREKNKTLNK